MNKITIILIALTLYGCQKDQVINEVINNLTNFKIEDKRTKTKKEGINVYADLEMENKDIITIQSNNTNWTCQQNIVHGPTITASFRQNNNNNNNNIKISKFKIIENDFLLNDKYGYFKPSIDNKELSSIYGQRVKIQLYSDDKLINSKSIYVNKPFCPLSLGSYNNEKMAFEINSGEDLHITWEADPNNEFGIAIALSKYMIGADTEEAYILLVDDIGEAIISSNMIGDYKTVSVGVFSEEELSIDFDNKISIACIHYSTFPLLVYAN